ncbi:hypothetical protein L914_01420, partial [Phytophthora nicotianae]
KAICYPLRIHCVTTTINSPRKSGSKFKYAPAFLINCRSKDEIF